MVGVREPQVFSGDSKDERRKMLRTLGLLTIQGISSQNCDRVARRFGRREERYEVCRNLKRSLFGGVV